MLRIDSLLFLLLMMAPAAWAEGRTYNIGMNGMSCPFCVYGVEKQLQKIDGVESMETDIKRGHIVVRMEDGKVLEKSQIEKAVKKSGFSLRSFEQAENDQTP